MGGGTRLIVDQPTSRQRGRRLVRPSLGERFLLLRMNGKDSAAKTRKALEHAGREGAMRTKITRTGRQVRVVADVDLPPGQHEFLWDGAPVSPSRSGEPALAQASNGP